jgi:hypothetical protein
VLANVAHLSQEARSEKHALQGTNEPDAKISWTESNTTPAAAAATASLAAVCSVVGTNWVAPVATVARAPSAANVVKSFASNTGARAASIPPTPNPTPEVSFLSASAVSGNLSDDDFGAVGAAVGDGVAAQVGEHVVHPVVANNGQVETEAK